MAEKSSELVDEQGTDINLAKMNLNDDNDLLELNSSADRLGETTSGDAEQIREQIEETRSQMSETIDAIQDKLSVANITEQVKEQVSEQIGTAVESAKDAFYDRTKSIAQTVGRSLASIGNTSLAKKTQENPWLTSVIGMGIGAVLVGVFFSGQKQKEKANYRYKNFDEDKYTKQTRQRFKSKETDEFKYQPTQNQAGESVNADGENVGNAANTAFAGVSNAAGSAYQSVSSAAGKTYQTVGKASSYAYEKAGDLGEEMKKNYEQYIEENPLVVGAVAFAVGAAIGYAIPSTKVENQYLGEMRDNVLDKAQASAQDAIGTVKQVVGEAQQIIVDEVKSQTAS